jgi:hypothetical protein
MTKLSDVTPWHKTLVLEISFESTLFDRPSFGSKVCSSGFLSMRKTHYMLGTSSRLDAHSP